MIHLGTLGSFDSFNPFIVKGITPPEQQHIINCYATLLSPSGNEPSSLYAYVAQSIEIANDLTWVAFDLNPLAKFDNGEIITAHDVAYSLKTLQKEGKPQFRQYYKAIENIEIVTPHRIIFHCPQNKNGSREIGLILGQLPIFSKKYYSKTPFSEATLTPPPSSGPYQICSYQPGRQVVYKRIKSWWGENIPSQKGLHNFDHITVEYYRDTNALFEAFKSGNIDIRFENSAKLWIQGYNFPAVHDGRVKTQLAEHKLCTGTTGFFFNLRRPLFQDIRVREALNKLFDFEWANQHLFFSQYYRVTSYFPNSPFEATGLPTFDEQVILEPFRKDLPKKLFTTPFSLSTFRTTKARRQIVKEALHLLEQAGWEIRNQKLIHHKTKKPFVLEFLFCDQTIERVALHLKACLSRVGISMSVRLLDAETYQERTHKNMFDIIFMTHGQSLTPGNEQRFYWGSQMAHLEGTKNIGGIKNPVIDKLIEKLICSDSYETLVNHTKALDRVLLWNHFIIPAWSRKNIGCAYWDRLNVPSFLPYNPLSISHFWYKPVPEKEQALLFVEPKKTQSSSSFWKKWLAWLTKWC